MPSSTPGDRRPVYVPPPDFAARNIPLLTLQGGGLYRVYATDRPPVHFGRRGGARFTPPGSPFGVLYLGVDVETCVFELFGDEMIKGCSRIRACRWMNARIARITVPDLKCCDLTNPNTLAAAGVDFASLLSLRPGSAAGVVSRANGASA